MRPDLDPSLLTPDERRREVAAILAAGLRHGPVRWNGNGQPLLQRYFGFVPLFFDTDLKGMGAKQLTCWPQ